jgi:two-component system heavy metal sensor histidine kinase CusS
MSLHHGHVGVSSIADQTTVFTLYFPLLLPLTEN